MIDERVEGYIGIEIQQEGQVARGQSLTRRAGQRVAKVAVTGVCNTRTGNEKRLQADLVNEAYRVRAFVPGCNTIGVRPE